MRHGSLKTSVPNSNVPDPQKGAPAHDGIARGAPGREEGFDFWRIVHRSLRGRYRLAMTIVLAGGVVGAAVGALMGKQLYSATGQIRIAADLPPVMRATDQNQPMAMFDGFILAQRDVMTSPETIQAAMKHDAWRAVQRTHDTPSGGEFARSLKVESRLRSDHLRVTFTNKDPEVAAAAVRSIIAAFEQVFVADQQRNEDQRMALLRARRDNLSENLRQIEEAIGPVADGHAAAELESLYAAASVRVTKLRSALTDVQIAMAGGPDVTGRGGASARSPGEAATEEILRSFITEQARLETQLSHARARGLLPAHRTVVYLEAAIQECRERVARYNEIMEQMQAAGPAPTPILTLVDREANLRKLTLAAEEEIKSIAARRADVTELDKQAAALRLSLAETTSRLDALTTEASLGGRLTVINSGDRPMTALIDNRLKTAALGAFVGATSPLGLLVLSGALRRRYRSCEDLAVDFAGRVPFVAVIPDVDEAGSLSTTAARCVHDLRLRLQPPTSTDRRVYLVTSATAGEGKSGLAISLGLSFAAAGFRTLLVDGDLRTRRLTLGFEGDDSPGMLEAAAGAEPQIRRVRAGLSVLTTGKCRPQDACRLSPVATGRVFAGLRDRFDVVLIDGDPVLTGLTASVYAPHADGVIVTLARGQEQSLAEDAVRYIALLGAEVSGVVFNRAEATDFRAILHEQELSTSAAGQDRPVRPNRFGPVVGAVLSSLSLSREDDLDLVSGGVSLARTDEQQRAVA